MGRLRVHSRVCGRAFWVLGGPWPHIKGLNLNPRAVGSHERVSSRFEFSKGLSGYRVKSGWGGRVEIRGGERVERLWQTARKEREVAWTRVVAVERGEVSRLGGFRRTMGTT